MSLALVFTGALSDGAEVFNGSIDKTDGKDLSRIIEALGGQYTRWNAESLRRGPCLPEILIRGAFSQTPSENRHDHVAIIPGPAYGTSTADYRPPLLRAASEIRAP